MPRAAPVALPPGGQRGNTRGVASLIYYDLTSPECFVLHETLGKLNGARALADVEWRGVQVDPSRPSPMRALDRRELQRLREAVLDAAQMAPDVRIEVPTAVPNTRVALLAVAAVERLHSGRAWRLREELFRAYWWHGRDLGEVTVVREAAAQAGVPPWTDLEDSAAQGRQSGWELAWRTERLGGVPRAVRADGQILWGMTGPAAIQAFFETPLP